MKKITLALLVLCLALPVFAGDADAATVELNGSAETTFGVDLDSQATGFTNTVTAEIQFHFNIPTTAAKDGMDMGTVYGEILLDEILLDSVQSADSSTVYWDVDIAVDHAKIWGPNWWISVLGPDPTIDYEKAIQNGIIGIAAAWDKQMNSVTNTIASSGGFDAGFSIPDIASVEASLFSITDWTSTDADAKNAYGMKASVSVDAVENLTLVAGMNMGFGENLTETVDAVGPTYGIMDDMGTPADTSDDVAWAEGDAIVGDLYWGVVTAATPATTKALNTDMGFGAHLAYALTVGDITITPDIATDIQMTTDGPDIAIGNGLTIGMPGSEITAAEDAIKDRAGKSLAWDDGVNSGLTLGYSVHLPAAAGAETGIGLQAHYGFSSIENLQIAAGFEAADLLDSNADMGMAIYGQYTMGDIKPWAGMFMIFDGKMVANAGVTWSNIVPLTTAYIDWRSGDLAATAGADLGILKVGVKVAY
jgi:hypothetical protein